MKQRNTNSPRYRLMRGYRQLNQLVPVSLQQELAGYLPRLEGLVLNAGAGRRLLSLPSGRLLSFDYDLGANVDFLADCHCVPLKDGCVDAVLSVAVLEHVRRPWVVVKEFFRVLRPGGRLFICVPFLQPEHAAPADYYRFTRYGAVEVVESAGFMVQNVSILPRNERIIAWIMLERAKRSRLLRRLLMPLAHLVSRGWFFSRAAPESVYSAVHVLAGKPGEAPPCCQEVSLEDLLVDPLFRQPLVKDGDGLVAKDGTRYHRLEGCWDLRHYAESVA